MYCEIIRPFCSILFLCHYELVHMSNLMPFMRFPLCYFYRTQRHYLKKSVIDQNVTRQYVSLAETTTNELHFVFREMAVCQYLAQFFRFQICTNVNIKEERKSCANLYSLHVRNITSKKCILLLRKLLTQLSRNKSILLRQFKIYRNYYLISKTQTLSHFHQAKHEHLFIYQSALHIFKTPSTRERCLTHAQINIKAKCLTRFEGWKPPPVKGPSVCRKGKDSRKGTGWGIARERKVTLHVLFRSNVISKTAYPPRDY